VEPAAGTCLARAGDRGGDRRTAGLSLPDLGRRGPGLGGLRARRSHRKHLGPAQVAALSLDAGRSRADGASVRRRVDAARIGRGACMNEIQIGLAIVVVTLLVLFSGLPIAWGLTLVAVGF